MALADATGLAMGKDVIRAADVPGFIVNRCNRPFGLEALRLLQERVADVADDRPHLRLGGGFRMGPFELSDLVGVDTGFDVSKSFYALSFGEPRWRPSPIQARHVAAGLHGRKTGRGYYDYAERSASARRPGATRGQRRRDVTGTGPWRCAARARPRSQRSRDHGRGARWGQSPARPSTNRATRACRGHRRGQRTRLQGPRPTHRRVQPAPEGYSGDRLSADQRVRIRARRRRRLGRRHRHRDNARPQPPPRPVGLGGVIGPDHVLGRWKRSARSTARSATAPHQLCTDSRRAGRPIARPLFPRSGLSPPYSRKCCLPRARRWRPSSGGRVSDEPGPGPPTVPRRDRPLASPRA